MDEIFLIFLIKSGSSGKSASYSGGNTMTSQAIKVERKREGSLWTEARAVVGKDMADHLTTVPGCGFWLLILITPLPPSLAVSNGVKRQVRVICLFLKLFTTGKTRCLPCF
ncbi:MAG: hypothetical protein H6668_20475 [Ardenticatenaceae bacterium]|nr:hypothetical protein [Ardenticatenaceae bacterium]